MTFLQRGGGLEQPPVLAAKMILTVGAAMQSDGSREIQPESARVEISLVGGAVAAHRGGVAGGCPPLEWGAEDARGLREGKVFSPGMTVAGGRLFSLRWWLVLRVLSLCINELREIIRQVKDTSHFIRQQRSTHFVSPLP